MTQSSLLLFTPFQDISQKREVETSLSTSDEHSLLLTRLFTLIKGAPPCAWPVRSSVRLSNFSEDEIYLGSYIHYLMLWNKSRKNSVGLRTRIQRRLGWQFWLRVSQRVQADVHWGSCHWKTQLGTEALLPRWFTHKAGKSVLLESHRSCPRGLAPGLLSDLTVWRLLPPEEAARDQAEAAMPFTTCPQKSHTAHFVVFFAACGSAWPNMGGAIWHEAHGDRQSLALNPEPDAVMGWGLWGGGCRGCLRGRDENILHMEEYELWPSSGLNRVDGHMYIFIPPHRLFIQRTDLPSLGGGVYVLFPWTEGIEKGGDHCPNHWGHGFGQSNTM